MSKNIEHIQHVKSNVVLEGKPKLPTSDVLVEGELAINYAEGYETISLKNSEGDIVMFSSDDYYTEQKLGSGFTGVNSALTVTDAIEESKITVDQVIDSGTSASTNAISTSAVYDKITEDELTWAIALNTLDDNINVHSANTAIHFTSGDVQTQISDALTALTLASNAVTAMTEYAIAASGAAITTSDTLNQAIGKLEKMIADLDARVQVLET